MTKLTYLNLHQQLNLCAWSDEDTPFDVHLTAMRDNTQWSLNVTANMDWTGTPQDLMYDMSLRPSFGQKGPVWSSGGWSPLEAAGAPVSTAPGGDRRRAIQVLVPYNMTRRPFACLQGGEADAHNFTRLPEEMMLWPLYTEENCIITPSALSAGGVVAFGRCGNECTGCCMPCAGLHYNHAVFVDYRDRRNDWAPNMTRSWDALTGSPHGPWIQSLPPFDSPCARLWARYFANDTLHVTWFTNRHRVWQPEFMADCVRKVTEWQAGVRAIRIMRNATKPLLSYGMDSDDMPLTGSEAMFTPLATLDGVKYSSYGSIVMKATNTSQSSTMPAHLYGTLPPQWGTWDSVTQRVTFGNVVLM
jgi:hypothetical protein